MAAIPKTIEAELLIRYSTGVEKVIGPVIIEVDAHYKFEFVKTDEPLPPTAVKDTLARVQGAAS